MLVLTRTHSKDKIPCYIHNVVNVKISARVCVTFTLSQTCIKLAVASVRAPVR